MKLKQLAQDVVDEKLSFQQYLSQAETLGFDFQKAKRAYVWAEWKKTIKVALFCALSLTALYLFLRFIAGVL
jgi:hypothetical protein